jgi:hypothetical protein
MDPPALAVPRSDIIGDYVWKEMKLIPGPVATVQSQRRC